MKKWVGYILYLYVLFCAVVPCTFLDNCKEDQRTAQTSKQNEKKDCNNCLPFSVCSSSYGFTIGTASTSMEPVLFYGSPAYGDYYVLIRSGYYSSFFQPPRAG